VCRTSQLLRRPCLAPAVPTSRGAPSAAVSFIIASWARCDLIEIEIEIEIRYITMTISVHSDTPERGEIPLRQRRLRAAAVTEFDAALTTLGIKQRSAAQWFRTSERNIRRWKSGARRTPPGVMVTVRLMLAGKIGPADVELAAASISTRTNGGAKKEPPAPLRAAPAPEEQPASAGCPRQPPLVDPSPTASVVEQVCALASDACRWPCGDPRDRNFRFCGKPTATGSYCGYHRAVAYLPPRPGRGHGVRVGFIVHGRHGRPAIPSALSAASAARAPISRAAFPDSASPPA
jgi:hypothetical protein